MARRERAFGAERLSALDDLVFRVRARRVLGRFPARAEIVADLGCGHDYRLLRYLIRQGRARQGIAVDLSLSESQAVAGIQLLPADLGRTLAIENAKVDVALSLAVLEHLDDPALHLAEAYRILRPGGTLLLTSPAPRSKPLLEFLAYRLHLIDENEIRDHRHYYNEGEIHDLLASAGFPRSRIEYEGFLLGLNQLARAIR